MARYQLEQIRAFVAEILVRLAYAREADVSFVGRHTVRIDDAQPRRRDRVSTCWAFRCERNSHKLIKVRCARSPTAAAAPSCLVSAPGCIGLRPGLQ